MQELCYTLENGSSLVFGRGVNEQCIVIVTTEVTETNKTLQITLYMSSSDLAAVLGNDAVITVVSNDCKCLAYTSLAVFNTFYCIISCDNRIHAFSVFSV